MGLQGSCARCQAPVFLNRTVDWYGNTVVTLNCWNGHYEWIHIEGIEETEDFKVNVIVDKTMNKKGNPVAYIGFFDIK